MATEIVKYFEIFLILSPFFLTVLLLGWSINHGLRKLEKYATYWLTGLILLLLTLTYGIFTDNISPYTTIIGYFAVERYWQAYLKRKNKAKP